VNGKLSESTWTLFFSKNQSLSTRTSQNLPQQFCDIRFFDGVAMLRMDKDPNPFNHLVELSRR
jgi:hypothetical protein